MTTETITIPKYGLIRGNEIRLDEGGEHIFHAEVCRSCQQIQQNQRIVNANQLSGNKPVWMLPPNRSFKQNYAVSVNKSGKNHRTVNSNQVYDNEPG
ncbi:MAG: hypothetical protein ACI4XW_11740 [Candidatus Spyradocola sp.]